MAQDQHFRDDQVREILTLAVERERGMAEADAARGLSLAELRAVAREVGLDPLALEAAAVEVSERDSQVGGSVTPRSELRQIRYVPAMPTGQGWDRIVRELRTLFGAEGVAHDLGSALEWSSNTSDVAGGPPIRVRLERVDGAVLLTLQEEVDAYRRIPDLVGAGLGFFGALYAGAGPLLGHPESGLWAGLALLSTGLIGSVGGRSVFRRWRRRAEERLTAAADRIALIVREEADRPEPNEGEPANVP